MKEKFYFPILRIVGAYIVFSLIWIFVSDRILYLSTQDIDTYVRWQTYKGYFFILISAAFLFGLLWYESRQRERSWNKNQKEREELLEQLQTSNDELLSAWDATIEGWAHTIELRDADTRHHSDRAVGLTLNIAQQMGITKPDDLKYLRWGALLHDIGKIGIPDEILNKPESLTPKEREIVNQHPILGAKLLSRIDYLQPSIDIPRSHHEWWDGSGYPEGLKGEEIPLPARIFAVVDVWDAMTSDRPYRDAITERDAIQHITEESGKHFDPNVVLTFLKIINPSAEHANSLQD